MKMIELLISNGIDVTDIERGFDGIWSARLSVGEEGVFAGGEGPSLNYALVDGLIALVSNVYSGKVSYAKCYECKKTTPSKASYCMHCGKMFPPF